MISNMHGSDVGDMFKGGQRQGKMEYIWKSTWKWCGCYCSHLKLFVPTKSHRSESFHLGMHIWSLSIHLSYLPHTYKTSAVYMGYICMTSAQYIWAIYVQTCNKFVAHPVRGHKLKDQRALPWNSQTKGQSGQRPCKEPIVVPQPSSCIELVPSTSSLRCSRQQSLIIQKTAFPSASCLLITFYLFSLPCMHPHNKHKRSLCMAHC